MLAFSPAGAYQNDTQDYINELNNVFIDTFGNAVNIEPETPIGYLIQNLVTKIQDRDNDLLYLKDALNVDVAVGVQLDNLGRFTLNKRTQATRSNVIVRCFGQKGTIIPLDYQIANSDDALFNSVTGGTITDEYIDLPFTAIEFGDINVKIGQVNKIINPIAGLVSVINLLAGSLGSELENDNSYRERIKDGAGINASGTYLGLRSSLLEISPNDIALVVPNGSEDSRLYSTETIPPYGLLIVVDPDINLIKLPDVLIKKCCATAPTVGNLIVPVEIPNSWGVIETYKVLRPEKVNMYITATISVTSIFDTNLTDNIKNILIDCFNGKLTTSRPQLYSDILATDYSTALVNAGYKVNLLQIGKSIDSYSSVIKYEVNQYPVLTKENIIIKFN